MNANYMYRYENAPKYMQIQTFKELIIVNTYMIFKF